MIIRYLSLVVAAALTLGASARAAEIEVLSTNALKTTLEELGPKFEQSSGHKLAITNWPRAALGGMKCPSELPSAGKTGVF